MKEIDVTHYDSIDSVIKDALSIFKKRPKYNCVGFVGHADMIQDVLRVALRDMDCVIDAIDMDTSEYNAMYQLSIDRDNFVSVLPVVSDCGEYVAWADDYLCVGDEMPLSYISALNDRGIEYKVFDFDYETYADDKNITETAASSNIMSAEGAQDVIDSRHQEAIYSICNKMPCLFQQLVDFMRDWSSLLNDIKKMM